MNKIPKSTAKSNRVKVIRGGLGFVIRGQSSKKHKRAAPPKRESGDIDTFSRHSQRRLRELLALGKLKSGEAAHIWGLTLTIPGGELPPDEVRALWGAFVDGMRAYPHIPLAWRIEEQTRADRRQAHWHCVAWVGGDEIKGRVDALGIASLWQRVVLDHVGALSRKTLTGFYRHGVDLKCLDGSTATGLIGYLCDHASKHKQEQLGWVGRQWGVVNRGQLDLDGVEVLSLRKREHKRAARQFRRLQEHLRADGVYTGGVVNPGGNVSKAIFGRDAERYLKIARFEHAQNKPVPPVGKPRQGELFKTETKGTPKCNPSPTSRATSSTSVLANRAPIGPTAKPNLSAKLDWLKSGFEVAFEHSPRLAAYWARRHGVTK